MRAATLHALNHTVLLVYTAITRWCTQNGRAAVAWLLERCRAHGGRCQLRYPAGEAQVSLSDDSRRSAASVSTGDGTRCGVLGLEWVYG